MNNAWENLAVLCLNCHGRVTGKAGLGRSFSEREVREFKREWEAKCGQSGAVEPVAGSVSPQTGDLESAVRRHALAAREGLNPAILPRISRLVVREKYLPAIRRTRATGRSRIVPIVAPTGYGKSTVLGEIYDALANSGEPWIILVRCNDLMLPSNISAQSFGKVLGEAACGTEYSLAGVVAELTKTLGGGVILIDTVDLILEESLVPALRSVLMGLVEWDTALAFTCRDYEYAAYLEPPRERLSGLTQYLDRYDLPEFSPAEVAEAVREFLRAHPDFAPHQGIEGFVRAVLQLSADNRPLMELTHNPLLLALMCELFGKDGHVPEDLTLSRLYERYWDEKVLAARRHREVSLLGLNKDRLCLAIASSLFAWSAERLSESAYEADLGVSDFEAYEDLLSERVIRRSEGGRVHFFHQTFLEYAIGRWLSTRSGAPDKATLLLRLKARPAGTHWWPVVRQLLAIVNSDEFTATASDLDLETVGAFRVVVQGAANRSHPSALLGMVAIANRFGTAHKGLLLNAIEAASTPLAESAWTIAVVMLADPEEGVQVKAARTAGFLYCRWPKILGGRLSEALEAIDRYCGQSEARSHLIGYVVEQVSKSRQPLNRADLRAIRCRYADLGRTTRATVIHLHVASGVSEDDRVEFLKEAAAIPLPASATEDMTELLHGLLPRLAGLTEGALETTWVHVVRMEVPEGWRNAFAHAVGRALNSEKDVRAVLDELLKGEPASLSRCLAALQSAIRAGAGGHVRSVLLSTPPDRIPPRCVRPVGTLVRVLACRAPATGLPEMIPWVRTLAEKFPQELIEPLLAVGAGSLSTLKLVIQLVAGIPPETRLQYISKLFVSAPQKNILELAPEIESLIRSAPAGRAQEITMMRLAAVKAAKSQLSLLELIRSSQKRSKRVAVSASKALTALAGEEGGPDPQELLPLTTSPFAGVRVNAFEALLKTIDGPSSMQETHLKDASARFKEESEEAPLQAMLRLIVRWVRVKQTLPREAFDHLAGAIAARLARGRRIDGGTARMVIVTLKVIAQAEIAGILPTMVELVQFLMRSMDVGAIRDGESESIDLLSAIARHDARCLAHGVDECNTLPPRNVRAFASAIKRVEGANSPLLDRLFGQVQAPEVKRWILELRGV